MVIRRAFLSSTILHFDSFERARTLALQGPDLFLSALQSQLAYLLRTTIIRSSFIAIHVDVTNTFFTRSIAIGDLQPAVPEVGEVQQLLIVSGNNQYM